jgi:hypothetical protein
MYLIKLEKNKIEGESSLIELLDRSGRVREK